MRTPRWLQGFNVFSLPVKGSFQRSFTVLFAIGLDVYLGLEVVVSQIGASYQGDATLELANACHSLHTGLSPCIASRSRELL